MSHQGEQNAEGGEDEYDSDIEVMDPEEVDL